MAKRHKVVSRLWCFATHPPHVWLLHHQPPNSIAPLVVQMLLIEKYICEWENIVRTSVICVDWPIVASLGCHHILNKYKHIIKLILHTCYNLQETQIFRSYVMWEEEQGFSQNPPQVLCFVTKFNRNDFISSDAMSKLRQVCFVSTTKSG